MELANGGHGSWYTAGGEHLSQLGSRMPSQFVVEARIQRACLGPLRFIQLMQHEHKAGGRTLRQESGLLFTEQSVHCLAQIAEVAGRTRLE